MYYLRARYYQPGIGRFVTPDTIVPDWNSTQALNRYPYVANNPVLYTDPSGQCPLCALWELVNPDNATPAGGDLYDENGVACGDTGCVPPAKSDSEVLPRVALDAAGAKVGEWVIGALWKAVKGPVTSGVEKLRGAIGGIFGRGGTAGAADATAAGLRPLESGLECQVNSAARLEGDVSKAGKGINWPTIGEKVDPSVVPQMDSMSCGPACGEMLSGGKLSQETIKQISGAPTGVEDLTRALNDLTPAGGGTWKGKFVGYDSDAFGGLRQRGPFAAEVYDPSERLGHFVIVDGLNSRGEVMIRDPWGEGTSYSVMMDTFLQYWTGLAVYQ